MASGSSGSEADLIWWWSTKGGSLGLRGQSYDFGEPRVEFLGADDAICRLLFGNREKHAADMYLKMSSRMRQFASEYPKSYAISRELYSERGWGWDMEPLRFALRLDGARHAVTLLNIAHRSTKLLAARNEKKPSESLLAFFRWQAAQQANAFVRDVRAELSRMADEVLVHYSAVRSCHVLTRKQEHERWCSEMLSEAAE